MQSSVCSVISIQNCTPRGFTTDLLIWTELHSAMWWISYLRNIPMYRYSRYAKELCFQRNIHAHKCFIWFGIRPFLCICYEIVQLVECYSFWHISRKCNAKHLLLRRFIIRKVLALIEAKCPTIFGFSSTFSLFPSFSFTFAFIFFALSRFAFLHLHLHHSGSKMMKRV